MEKEQKPKRPEEKSWRDKIRAGEGEGGGRKFEREREKRGEKKEHLCFEERK